MKKLLPLLIMLFALQLKAQLYIPLFEPPQKIDVLSDRSEETSALTFNSGEAMFFNRTYEKLNEEGGKINAQDVWFAQQGKKGWKAPFRAFRDLAGDQIELLIGCSEDGEKLYLLNRYFVKGSDSIASRIVYKTRSGKTVWKDPIEIPVPGLDLSDQQTTIFMHSSGEVILISKLTEDATPNEDLYVMHKENGSWSELIDLGSSINTKGLEFSPFLTHDKKALYFASNGHKGFGESDIFVSYRRDDKWDRWTKPMNLGVPINSEAFEASFIISDSANVYFTSDRNSDNTDIYHTKSTGEYKIANEGILVGQVFKDRQPLKAAKLNVFDSKGRFIETVTSDDNGKFKFVKLQAEDSYVIKQDTLEEQNLAGAILYVVDGEGELRKRLLFTEEGESMDAKVSDLGETVVGKFMSEGQPLLNTALVILDENGFPIDTVYTNDKGEFTYQKLTPDKDIFVTPRDISKDEFATLDLFLTDEEGNKTKVFLGEEIPGTVVGKFTYKALPLSSTQLKVLDENGLPIDTIYTNQNGEFKYVRLNPDDEVTFEILNSDDYEMADLKLETEDSDEDLTQTVLGKFNYKGLPLVSTPIAALNEDGLPIDTLLTDENGEFSYQKLKADEKVSFTVLHPENFDMTELSLDLLDEQGKKMQTLSFENAADIALNQEKDESAIDMQAEKEKVEEVKKSVLQKAPQGITVYFDFNQSAYTTESGATLNSKIQSIKGFGGKVSLTGHTDSKGSDAYNQRLSLQRAQAVKAFLTRNGVKASQIQVTGKGEAMPIESNETEEGRAKNRRVEISFK